MNAKKLLVASLAVAGALVAGAAQAHVDVSVNLGAVAPVFVPVPRIVREPVFGLPVPVPGFVRVPEPVAPRIVHEARWDRDHDGIPDRFDRHDNRRDRRWDHDGDGVPNRYDHHDNNPRRW